MSIKQVQKASSMLVHRLSLISLVDCQMEYWKLHYDNLMNHFSCGLGGNSKNIYPHFQCQRAHKERDLDAT